MAGTLRRDACVHAVKLFFSVLAARATLGLNAMAK
jgi:hypothetical protein